MVKLNDEYLNNPALFNEAGISVSKINQEEITNAAVSNPIWVHFGAGNLFRAFHAEIAQDLLENGELKSGVIVVETWDPQVVTDIYEKYNNRHLMVTMTETGEFKKRLNTSVAQALFVDKDHTNEYNRLLENFYKS